MLRRVGEVCDYPCRRSEEWKKGLRNTAGPAPGSGPRFLEGDETLRKLEEEARKLGEALRKLEEGLGRLGEPLGRLGERARKSGEPLRKLRERLGKLEEGTRELGERALEAAEDATGEGDGVILPPWGAQEPGLGERRLPKRTRRFPTFIDNLYLPTETQGRALAGGPSLPPSFAAVGRRTAPLLGLPATFSKPRPYTYLVCRHVLRR